MNFLQLHDGPAPLDESLNPYAPGAAVWKEPSLTLISGNGCAASLPGAIQKGSARDWQGSIEQALSLYVKIAGKEGMSQAFVSGSLAVIATAIKYLPQIILLGYSALQGFTKNQINALAQSYYDQNRYNMQNLCTMSTLELESKMLTLDQDIATTAEAASNAPMFQKGQYKRSLAVISELRVIYEQQLAMNGGAAAPKKGLLSIGLIAAALSLFR